MKLQSKVRAMTKAITLRDANQNLGRYIRKVENGAEFIVTWFGQPIARLSPTSPKRALHHTRRAVKKIP